ncbi:MAG: PD40 domain-containing protein [Anaerolineae bacterium]|nr:PD40 domain-containing protein [Anaerolineae bacterium]
MRKLLVLIIAAMLGFAGSVNAQDVLPTLPGQIAFIGNDGNVYTLGDQGSGLVAITNDASSSRQYQWPTWSTDGRLAYFSTRVDGDTLATDVYISNDGREPGEVTQTIADAAFTYAYWSPQDCEIGCRDLGILLSDTNAGLFTVQLLRDQLSDTTSMQLVGQGAPFYFSWSPDGKKMLLQRNNARLEIFHVANDGITETLTEIPGMFQSPAWSPVDDRWLFGALTDELSTDIVIGSSAESRTLIPNLAGRLAFSWSPNGNFIAYTVDSGSLQVVDAQTGALVSSSASNGIYSFFWSPDSTRIAYITLATPPGSLSAGNKSLAKAQLVVQQQAPSLSWSILNIETGRVRRYGAFTPTNEMIYLLSFFDQFAQSHRLWSPDSRYLLYAERAVDGSPVLSLLDTAQADTVPLSITQGVIGIWSYN